ncbi:MAG: DMT family transporter [Chlamydiales bacterium]|nr:DMT family transporter [Chlamydiales bacterium]
MRTYNVKLAVIFSLLAALLFALSGVVIKLLSEVVPNEMIVFFRQLFALLFLLPIIIGRKGRASLKPHRNIPLYLLRTFASLAAMYCLVYAIKYLSLVDALLLSYTRALFMPLIVFLWFGKRPPSHVWWGLLVGFAGVACILKPSNEVFDIAALVGVASGLFGAVAFSAVRRLTKTEFPTKIMLYYLLLSIPITAVPLARSWIWLDKRFWLALVLLGFIGVIYQYMLTKAYEHAKGPQVASVLYSTVIFAAFFDWIFWKEALDGYAVLGIGAVIAGSLIALGLFSRGGPKINGNFH